MQPGIDAAVSQPSAQGSRRIPAPRGRAAAARDRKGRRTRARARRTALSALALPVAGAVVDELVSSSLGWTFVATAVIGAAWAAMTCSKAGAWWVAYAPPLVVTLITVVAEQAVGKTGAHGKGLTTGAVHWAVDAFPAMAAAEVALIAVLAVRWFRSRRSVRKNGA
ncbi:DUF6542 domain-containing protein [Streptomyces sp. NPDC051173]|uniref:DUF6542 domain-containing protein n=1 Tax=Streptomyces sp. NPDC051173 TaxID=3155164 RepID=UPI00344C98D3